MNIVGRQCWRALQNNTTSQHLSHRVFSFKSAISLENLYPESKQKLYTPSFVPDPKLKFDGFIPMKEMTITYSASSGPGGQHVNRVNTKVDLRFQLSTATWLAEDIRTKLAEQEKNRINKAGFLIIKSDLTRSQHLNLADVLEKLRAMIRSTLVEPPKLSLETEEKKRKNLLKAARQRLHEKRARSQIKQGRREGRMI